MYRVRRSDGRFVVTDESRCRRSILGRRFTVLPDLVSARGSARRHASRAAGLVAHYRIEKYSPDALGWILIENYRVEDRGHRVIVDGEVIN
ncbi:hypothetical protein [uncultured Williamsia sp.]|uniref:hypothetical protein n=1 Tax=uncultured Williamsia sp. TaxID=259311 RepID=UPI002625540A|nr:hypothetical protein [uncultured Williamsia sp.]